MQAIVVTFDRLATRLLGCYGNEWVETPNFDRLAATSTVFDNHFADSVGPRRGQSWLTGRHPLSATPIKARPLGEVLKSAGVASTIIAVEQASDLGWATVGFDPIQRVSGKEGLEAHPTDVPFAHLIRAGMESICESVTPGQKQLIWLHAPEPSVPPEGFATLYAEDFEERGVILNDLPRSEWEKQIAVAAGAMSLIDHWVGELIAQITANSQQHPTLLLIAGGAGRSWADDFFATACAAQTGSAAERLRDMETRSPLLLSVVGGGNDSEYQGVRCQRFVQPADLAPTLLDWFQIAETDSTSGRSLLREAISEQAGRGEIFCSDDEQRFSIRNAHWNCLLQLNPGHGDLPLENSDGSTEQVQLFSKPEDIWDVTDLATQFPEICDDLTAKLVAFRAVGESVAAAP